MAVIFMSTPEYCWGLLCEWRVCEAKTGKQRQGRLTGEKEEILRLRHLAKREIKE